MTDYSQLSEEEQLRILELAQKSFSSKFEFDSLEELVCSPEGFNLDELGTVTPMQRVLCRLIEGRPLGEHASDPIVASALGIKDAKKLRFSRRPAEIVVLAAVRTAKSLIAAANAIWASQTCDLGMLRDGEIARYSILSLELDNARVVLGHLIGALEKPALKGLRVDPKKHRILQQTGSDVVGSEYIRHPSGKVVEIRVIAGKRAGGSLVSRWSAGCTLDEAPRMVGSSEGVINYDDARRAVRSRLLPGAQILSIGSPWAPYGPIYDIVQEEWGRPNNDRVIVRARGPDMNPVWWNPERCEEVKRSDPITYQTDVLAEFADEEEMLFTQEILRRCTREGQKVIPHRSRHDYVAAIDPATRGNAFTLVVAGRLGRVKEIVYTQEWRGSPTNPLSPRRVFKEIAEILEGYELGYVLTDQWAADAMCDIATEEGLSLIQVDYTTQETVDTYTSLATAMADGTVSIPDDRQLLRDFKMVKKKPTNRGFSIVLPSTADGRHCDYMPAVTRALKQWLDDERWIPPEKGEEGYEEYLEAKMLAEDDLNWERERMKEMDPFGMDDMWDDPWETWEEERDLLDAAREIARRM